MTTRPPPLPAVIVRDDRPSPTPVLGVTTGRRCTLCEAWAASYARLRHVDGCKGSDLT